jgi:adenylate cyclase
MFTDMVGYTALGQRNESLSLALVEEQRKLIRPILARHNGIEIKTMGDAFLVEFPNALDAVRCAYDIQRATKEFNVSLPAENRIHLRVGLHLGDVVESQGDISGDAVNVASRVEPLAEDGGVCLTRQVYDQVESKFDLPMVSIGPKALKNVKAPVEVYKVAMPWEQQPTKEEIVLPRDRIAILPFTSFSLDPNDAFFADGVTDEITSAVSGISGLSVISRTSVIGYKGTTKKVKEIGKELNVGSILEGTFKKAGNRIRVTAQLIDVAADKHLWAQNYDRNLDDVFEVQSDVARQVADALRVRILAPERERIEKKPTESTEAYTLYLKGRYLWSKRGLEDLKKACEYFEQAVKEDPDFALGYAGQADCALLLRSNWGIDPETNLEKAKFLTTKALDLDPGLAEIHATRGLICSTEYDFRRAEEEFKKAIALKPSYATAHMWYHQILLFQQRWNEALERIERTVELDPFSSAAYLNQGIFHLCHRDYSKAVEPLKRAAELDHPYAHGWLASAYGMMKTFDDMEREISTYVKLFKDLHPLVGKAMETTSAYYRRDKETVSRLLPELEINYREAGIGAYDVACLLFYLSKDELGFDWLEKSYLNKELFLPYLRSEPALDGIRTNPRYLDLLKRLGLDQTAQPE